MVVINLKGGLGNQLFEYAASLAIAKQRNQELKIDIKSFENDPYGRTFGLNSFNIENKTCSKREVNRFLKLSVFERLTNALKSRNSKRYYSLGDLEVDVSILEANPKDQYLNGYFANPTYFNEIRDVLLEKIALKDEFKTDLFKKKIEWIRQNNFVSVHIRRADYISDKGASQLFETLDRNYYNRCIEHFKSKNETPTKFLFFSDDIPWVRNEFKDLENIYFIEERELYKDYYDLMFMAACDHNIIANSTFSWWSAWLNKNPNKTVLAPRAWYRNQDYQAFFEKTKFIPETWILI
ncbi:alpha-1,2-fucosyltransferase [Winogradskyella eckloniae]|uniref:alpha-1,2-fucosyltransferase n=1 Tax=Winogradskyella eckloniae TaxID=1089306 RepID=UPI00156386F7|nr:alpha-1,2-fucosyltransferase [Winogradskyella eckloniae]NRD20804.1 alpha-1,2-fucosyltransferase [Winogradskyella eckloniae]